MEYKDIQEFIEIEKFKDSINLCIIDKEDEEKLIEYFSKILKKKKSKYSNYYSNRISKYTYLDDYGDIRCNISGDINGIYYIIENFYAIKFSKRNQSFEEKDIFDNLEYLSLNDYDKFLPKFYNLWNKVKNNIKNNILNFDKGLTEESKIFQNNLIRKKELVSKFEEYLYGILKPKEEEIKNEINKVIKNKVFGDLKVNFFSSENKFGIRLYFHSYSETLILGSFYIVEGKFKWEQSLIKERIKNKIGAKKYMENEFSKIFKEIKIK